MTRSRTIALLTAVAAVLATMLVTAPQAAANTGRWQPWNPGWTTKCGSTTHHPVTTRVIYQTCFVLGSANYIQPVLVVTNHAPNAIRMQAVVQSTHGTPTSCPDTFLSAGYSTACLGTTFQARPGRNVGWSDVFLYNAGDWYRGTTDAIWLTYA
ncbi:hypothetical protein AB0G74_27970 [Streptomyces sp. NPDC020875]|uniref:hypothetical protein n=1 Tax=Streptomyces sp. NPDC020875 TaxID=3154898 RepID=UPI0033E8D55C